MAKAAGNGYSPRLQPGTEVLLYSAEMMGMGMSLRQHVKVGAASGFLVFVLLWLTAIIIPSVGEPIFELYDHFSPYTIIGFVSDSFFGPSQREGGILFVLGAWALYTIMLGVASGIVVYHFRVKRYRQSRLFRARRYSGRS